MTPERPKSDLEQLVREARDERGPELDWAKVEEKLFPRVEREARAQAALGAYAGSKRGNRGWGVAAAVLAVAATIPLFMSRGAVAPLGDDAPVAEQGSDVAGSLSEKDRNASVHATVNGATHELAPGDAFVRGESLDVHGGRAIFAREAPGAVTWALEDSGQVQVRAAAPRSTLILALAKGAVEAQVAPVAEGEAFAIDIEGTRVAVHGTHLRVERQGGGRAVVDLREGVVSIGLAPKSGSTYGDLVTAPAHVEFDSADPHGTLKVTHDVARVRAAQTLEIPGGNVARRPTPGEAAAAPHMPAGPIALPSQRPVAAPAHAAPAAAPAPPPAPEPVVAAVPAPAPAPATSPEVDPNPERTIVDQVRACARKHVSSGDGVVITVSTRLELRVGDSGMVSSAIFEPPLAPEVQACAAAAIYGTRFGQPGALSIAIDVTP